MIRNLFLLNILILSFFACSPEEGGVFPGPSGSPLGEQQPPAVRIVQPSPEEMFYSSAITVTGVATDNTVVSNVFIRVDAGDFHLVTLNGSNWSTNMALDNGVHTVSVYAVDTNYNYSLTNSRAFTVSVDSIRPLVTVQSPGSGATLNETNITVSGTASDNRRVEHVYLKINGGAFSPVICAASNWSTNIALVEGAHSVAVYAVDTNGNCSLTNNRSFTIALDAPAVVISSPSDGLFTNTASITVTGTATLHSGTITGVETKVGSGGYASASSSDSWATWTGAVILSEGNNTVTARVSADSGKQSEVSIGVVLDTASPVLTALVPKFNTNRFKADNSIYFDLSSASDLSGIRKIVVTRDGVFCTNKLVSEDALSGERIYIAALNTVGSYQFGFSLVDAAGNVSAVSNFTASTYYEPELRVTAPAGNSYTAQERVTVTGTATITAGAISLVRVKVGDAGSWVTATSSDSWATWSVEMPLAAGNNKIIVEAVSAVGDIDTATIWNVYSDRTAPTAAVTGPADGFSIETDRSFMITANCSEDVSAIGVGSLVILTNGAVFKTITNPSDTESIPHSGFATGGSYTISVYAVNGVGRYSSTNSITVSAISPFLRADSLSWTPSTSTAGTFLSYVTLSLDATVYYVIVNKGYPPTAAQLKAGVDYSSGGENVTVKYSGSTPGTVGSVFFSDYISGLLEDIPVHVYCVAETAGSQFSKVRFAGSFIPNSSTVLPIMETLVFTEYIEGTGDNKVLEIYNGTGQPVALDQYWIHYYANSQSTPYGSGWAAGRSGVVLGQGAFYVFCNSGADSAVLGAAQKDVGSLDYNGNDSIVLLDPDGLVVDSIGKIGENPDKNTGWTGTNGMQTVDRTLRRRLSIRKGDSDPNDTFDPDVEWISHPNGTFDGLGSWQE